MIRFSHIIHPANEHQCAFADIVAERYTGDTPCGKYPPLHMLGPAGAEREIHLVQHMHFTQTLPVLIGLGFGHALRHILAKHTGPIAVVDKEKELLPLTKAWENISAAEKERITYIDCTDNQEALRKLTQWQKIHGGLPLKAVPHPFYLRLDRFFAPENAWYGLVRKHVEASTTVNFWERVRQPRFTQKAARVLLITSKYFLMGEVMRACQNMHIEHKVLTLPSDSMSSQEFIENLLKAVVEFQPDCLLTLNHLGVDREGILMGLLEELQLPLASWFVDNPHLIVNLYEKLKSPWVTIFTWDADNIQSLQHMGFEHVFHLPLGTDAKRFAPTPSIEKNAPQYAAWKNTVSFVGNSMVHKVATRLSKTPFPVSLLEPFSNIAQDFDASEERSVATFMKHAYPQVYTHYMALADNEERLGYETAITWEATRIYRARCVAQTLPFAPLIVGDSGWKDIFAGRKEPFTLHRELNYYEELPTFYPLSDINFNCTSKQMKGAVNQRIFDVPACNGFVLTDWREQMDDLFEPHKEIAFYTEPEEIPELIQYYLKNPQKRAHIASAARKRVLAEHTWEHRLAKLLQDMRSVYGIQAHKKSTSL